MPEITITPNTNLKFLDEDGKTVMFGMYGYWVRRDDFGIFLSQLATRGPDGKFVSVLDRSGILIHLEQPQ